MNIDKFVQGVVVLENRFLAQGALKQRAYSQLLKSVLSSVRLFSFNYDTSPELAQFGVEMMERKLFQMPYPICLYKFPYFEKSERSVQEGREGDCYVLVIERDKGEWLMVSVMAPQGSGDPVCDVIGRFTDEYAVGKDPNRKPSFVDESEMQKGEECFSLAVGFDEAWAHSLKFVDDTARKALWSNLICTASAIVGLTTSLNSKDVKTEDYKIPEKLNKARMRKGKHKLRDYVTVKLDINSIRKIRQDAPAGTHASPVIHWRRGHWRTLKSGQIVPVAPCIVGAKDPQELPEIRPYQVQKEVA